MLMLDVDVAVGRRSFTKAHLVLCMPQDHYIELLKVHVQVPFAHENKARDREGTTRFLQWRLARHQRPTKRLAGSATG